MSRFALLTLFCCALVWAKDPPQLHSQESATIHPLLPEGPVTAVCYSKQKMELDLTEGRYPDETDCFEFDPAENKHQLDKCTHVLYAGFALQEGVGESCVGVLDRIRSEKSARTVSQEQNAALTSCRQERQELDTELARYILRSAAADALRHRK